jgi:hypothetical protein
LLKFYQDTAIFLVFVSVKSLPLCLIIILIRELLTISGIGWSGRFESVNYRKIVTCKVVLARRTDA